MRLLIDANNLMFALAEVAVDADRAALASMLAAFARREGIAITAVFDGRTPHPRGGETEQEASRHAAGPVTVIYSGPRKADEVLADLVDADSSPRQLMVVSSDRQVQRHAHRRRCKVVDALDFARLLKVRPHKAQTSEPAAKTKGLSAGQLEQWLKEFGLDQIQEDKDEDLYGGK